VNKNAQKTKNRRDLYQLDEEYLYKNYLGKGNSVSLWRKIQVCLESCKINIVPSPWQKVGMLSLQYKKDNVSFRNQEKACYFPL